MKDLLKKEVERIAGRNMRLAVDFEMLSDKVFERTGERLSSTTLKRFWGYLRNEQVQTSLHTLDVLSRYIGYRDHHHFSEQIDNPDRTQSGFVYEDLIHTEELSVGQRLALTWLPDRRIVVEYLGDARFVIREVKYSHLHVGDTFECHLMVQHEHLLLDKLIHDGIPQRTYVIGNIDGVVITSV